MPKINFNLGAVSTKKETNVRISNNENFNVTRKCAVCGKEFTVASYYGKGLYCSVECANEAKRSKPNLVCEVCGKPIYRKPSAAAKIKHPTCSRECAAELKRIAYKGINNPNYNNRKERLIEYNNGKPYYLLHLDEHPYGTKAKGVGVYYKEHRFIVEQNHNLFDDKYFNIINNKYYLKPEIDVHHINKNGLDNRIENLIPLTRSEHTSIHNKEKVIIRDDKGKITGISKQGELLETHNGNDNQQPSIISNNYKGSTTNSRVQTDNAEDSNANTSALPIGNNSDDIV